MKEKSLNYTRTAFICFVDFAKAFDLIQLKNFVHLLDNRHIPDEVIKTIDNHGGNQVQAKINGELNTLTPAGNDSRQGDSLSPLTFYFITHNEDGGQRN